MTKFKRLTKALILCVLSLVMAIGCFSFTACTDTPTTNAEQQIVTLSVNPEIEFIVDEEDKVISVTASNEDGIYLLEKFSSYTGLTIQEASLKFLELCEEYGFVISGSVTEQNFTISVSGDGAEKLFNDIKQATSNKVSELGIQVDEMVKIGKDKLKDMVKECYQDLSSLDLAKLSETELVEKIKKSREETKDLHTLEEKMQFYFDRAYAVTETKIKAIKDYISQNDALKDNAVISQLLASLDSACLNIKNSYDSIKAQIETKLAEIKAELETYVENKESYLTAFEEYKNAKENNQANLEDLRDYAEGLKESADGVRDEIKAKRDALQLQIKLLVDSTINSAMTQINALIDSILEVANISVNQIQAEVNGKIEDLKDIHKNGSKNPWERPQEPQNV